MPITSRGADVPRASGRIPWRPWLELALGFAPSIVFFFAYNQLRFGTPLESGYALATPPDWLAERRVGLFSIRTSR